MSAEEFEQVKAEVLRLVTEQRKPANPDRIVSAVSKKTHRSDKDVRRAMWYLIARDQIGVTPDWHLLGRAH